MTPVEFPESNQIIGPPKGMTEEQIKPVHSYVGRIRDPNSSLDGADYMVVAWKPDIQDLERILQGEPVYLTVFGGLPGHLLTTYFPAIEEP